MATVKVSKSDALTSSHLNCVQRIKRRVSLNAIFSLLVICLVVPFVPLSPIGWVIAAPFLVVALTLLHRSMLKVLNWLDPITLQIGDEQFHNLALVSKINEVTRREKV